MFVHFLLVLTATRSAAALTIRVIPIKAPHPWDTGRSDGYFIRRRTVRPEGRFVRNRGAWPAGAGVLAVAPVRRGAARRRRNARTPAAVGGHRSSNGRWPTASRPYPPRQRGAPPH